MRTFSSPKFDLRRVIRHKSFVGLMIQSEIPFGSEGMFDDLDDPVQHFVEAKQFEEQLGLVAGLCLGKSKMNPYPNVSQHEGNAHEQEPQPRIARAGLDPRLVHLPVAGLDAKSLAIELANLAGSAAYLPHRIQKLLATPLAGLLLRVVLAGKANSYPHAGFLFLLGLR